MDTKQLLNTGTAIPIIFWVSTIIAGFIHGNYNHLTGTISELGALWAHSHIFMTAAAAICGLLSILFLAGLFRACKQLGMSSLPIYTIISFPFTLFWIVAYPLGTSLHAATGPVMLLMDVGALLALFIWRGKNLVQLRTLTLISLLIMLLIFLRFIPAIGDAYPGLIQRFAHLGWSVWFVSLNISMVKLLNNQSRTSINKS